MRVLSVVAVALLPAYAFRLAYLLLFDGSGRVVDGVLAFDGQAWVVLAAASLVWLATVLLGVAVLDDGPHPLRRTRQALPAGVGVLILLWALVGVAGIIVNAVRPTESPADVLVLVVVGVSVVALATPLVLWAVAAVVRGVPRPGSVDLTGRRWRTGAELAIGLVVPALVATTAAKLVPSTSFATSIASTVFSAGLAAIAVVVQSLALLNMYRRIETGAPPEPPVRRRPSRPLLAAGIAALVIPAALNVGVVAAAGLPTVNRGPEAIDQVWALGWPAGRGPVLVTQDKILDCLDNACSRYSTTDLTISVTEPTGTAVILPDGTVYALGEAEGIEICDPQRHCEGGRTRGRIDPLGAPRAAHMAIGRDGNPIIATLAAAEDHEAAAVTLHTCHDRLCKTSDATVLGTVPNATPEESWDRRVVALDLDSSGHAAVAVRWGPNVRVYGQPSADQQERLDMAFRTDSTAVAPDGRRYTLHTVHSGLTSRTELVICSDRQCRDEQHIRVDQMDGLSSNLPGVQPDELWLLAVAPDGHVAAVRPYMFGHFFTITP